METISTPTANSLNNVSTANSACSQFSNFSSSVGQLLVGEQKFLVRVLKMIGSTMVFVTNAEQECIVEFGVAVPATAERKSAVSTTIMGADSNSESQRLAESWTNRFKRQFFVSFNVQLDRLAAPLLEKELSNYMRQNQQQFV